MARLADLKRVSLLGFALLIGQSSYGAPARAQVPQVGSSVTEPYRPPPFYEDAAPFEMTLFAPFRRLQRDRDEESPYHAATITYGADGETIRVPVRVRTRGFWRKHNCEIPPLLLNFARDSTRQTAFAGLDRERLTMHCRDNDTYEQYVLQEFQLYRVHRALTPFSYDVRLVRVIYVDSERNDTLTQRWAFLSEQDDAFAARLGVELLEVKGAVPADLQPYESALFGVFQYFIGHGDFSINALHNVVLVRRGRDNVPVARDFDWSGAVNARYAKPHPLLETRTIRERVMRGYCAPAEEYEKVFELFRDKKEAIYALYHDAIAAPLDPEVVQSTLEYYDDFYEIINDPRVAREEIVEACLEG